MLDKTVYTFLTVAECGSMNKAASQLYISPTAVMNELNRLEGRLGVTLFTRTNRGLLLTDAGKAIYHNTKILAQELEMTVARARQMANPDRVYIRIGNSHLRACEPFLEAWNKPEYYRDQFRLTIVPVNDEVMDSWVYSMGRDFDILGSICDITYWTNTFNFMPLWDCKYAIAVPKGHSLAQRDHLTMKDLFGERLLVLPTGNSAANDRIRRDLTKNYPQIYQEASLPHYDMVFFNRCAEEGILGLTVDMWANVHPALRTIPIDWEYTIPYGIMYPLHPSPQLVQFLDIVRAAHMESSHPMQNKLPKANRRRGKKQG